VTNETGAYQFASLQTGLYKVTSELPGFQTQTYNNVNLGVGQQVRLNFALQVATQAQNVEVNIAADTLIATTSSSVGAVLPEYKVRDLPLSTRNILDLVNTTPGVQGSNFAGTRLTQLNTTRDGIPVSDGRYDIGAATTTYTSPDLVDEVRVIVAPADAELGRGSGQIQMSTRSGTNDFRGSLFWVNRNSKLAANSWQNNFFGTGKNYYNGNQFGGRVGGPVIKNKTFFFFLFDGQRYVTKSYFTGPVLTDQARQGIFRFFPGVQGGNAVSTNPTVDRNGNPVSPLLNGQPVALSSLASANVFGRDVNGVFTPWDANRTGFDSSGYIKRLIGKMPSPNDFTSCGTNLIFTTNGALCDGLNVAGYRWLRRNEGVDVANGDGQDTDRNQYNVRIDHNFNSSHKASFSGTWERDWAETTQAGMANWPGGYNGLVRRAPRVITGSLVSTLSPTVVNEFRMGSRKNWNYSWSSIWRPDAVGDAARKELPTHAGVAFFPTQALFPDHIITSVSGAATRGQTSPIWTFSDTLSWTQGKHAFKGGYELRLTSSRGWNGTDNPDWYKYPVVTVGAGGAPVTGINTISGLTGNSVTVMQNLLLDLTGSVSAVPLTFNILKPTDQEFVAQTRIKDYHQNEWGAFFKDDWKIHPNLTLNLGVRYDWYGVPWESNGMHALPVGGAIGLYGITAGAPTVLQLVGKNSPHPDTLFYQNDWNNFAPAVGLSWSLPWGGKDKTVLRAGYGMSYQGAASYNAGLNVASGNNPGLSFNQSLTTLGLGNKFFNFASPDLPIPVPEPTGVKPLTPQGLYTRTDPLVGFDDHRVNPYVQNFNLEIQRELAKNLTFEARYIGSKGTKLYGGVSLDDMNIFAQGAGQTLLDAFNQTRAGGDAPLFDLMFKGLVVNTGQSAVGTNGVTGSAAIRQNSTFRQLLADGRVGEFANTLNSTTLFTTVGAGGLIKNAGLPENWLVPNPQYAAVVLSTNPGSSTYHSMNLQVTKRLSNGFASSFAYTWSRALGDASLDGNTSYLDPNNHHLNKSLLTFHRTHDIRSNGTFELPFGTGRKFLSSSNGIVGRLVERWQLGGIMTWSSGQPLTITATNSQLTWTQVPGQIAITRTSNTPNIFGSFPKGSGEVTPIAAGATYFPGLVQNDDPSKNAVADAQTLRTAFSNKAIFDAKGNIILANPTPGVVGTLGRAYIEGPGHIKFDVNLVKRIRVSETKNVEIRMDVIDILNTPWWNNPIVDINNPSFGRMDAADVSTGLSNADNRTANRKFTFSTRLNF
jgi:TonB-dependent receptor-like protein/carboxypeptidase family protein